MAHESHDDPADVELMKEVSAALVSAVEAAVAPWVEAAVVRFTGVLDERARHVAAVATREVTEELRDLLSLDIEAQRTTPLAVLRAAARYPTEVLAAAGVPPVQRDAFDQQANPDDLYGVAAATWADFGEEVGAAGIAWGAAKAHLHLRRHR
ncbi:MAG: hypothetical protein K1X38_14265 [Microthrixaceae bacterium]|nr:hypothetical protein [Microthrixaceae bacterium]